MKGNFVKTAIAAAICAFAAGCNDNSPGAGPSPGGGAGPTISGTATAGAVSGATVKVFALTSTGTDGAQLGSGTTDASGAFSLSLSSAPAGGVRVEVSGGTYTSEADTTVTSTNGLLSVLLTTVPSGGLTGIAINPLTTFADGHTTALLTGSASASTGPRPKVLTLPSAYTQGNGDIAALFGFASSLDLATLLANFDATDTDAGQLALALGALEQLAKQTGKTPAEIIAALLKDLSDGIPDGKDSTGAPVLFDATHPAPATLGNNDLLGALATYLNTSNLSTYLHQHSVTPGATIVNNLRAGIVKYAPAAASLNTGSSGAITSLAYSGKQVVLIAARSRGLHLVDITDPTTPVEDPLSTLNTSLQALSTPFGNVGGVIAIPGSPDPTVLLFSYSGQRVVIANIVTQAIVQDVDLSSILTTVTSFSGGSAYISGGIADPVRNVIWLATGDGYIPFDIATNTAGTAVPLVPTQDFIAENIGGDVSHDLLFSPNYGGAGFGGGVQVVNLATRKAYALDDTLYQSAFTVTGGGSFGIVDSGAVDSSYRVGVMVGEDVSYVGFLDLHDPTKYTFDDTAQSFTFAPSTLAITQTVDASNGSEFSGSAIDSTTHLALLMAGYSSDILVGKLDNPAAPTGATWAGFTDWRYYGANSSTEYSYARDPHAVAAVNSSANGHSYGFLLSDDGFALMVDMQAFLAAAATPSSSGGDDHRLAVTPFDGTIVKRIALTSGSPLAAGHKKASMQKRYATKSRTATKQ